MPSLVVLGARNLGGAILSHHLQNGWSGAAVARSPETVNTNLPTGAIEVFARDVTVQSRAEELPLIVNSAEDYPEETRLKYRFVDLRRERVHANIMLRSNVIASLRKRMTCRRILMSKPCALASA